MGGINGIWDGTLELRPRAKYVAERMVLSLPVLRMWISL